MFITISVGHQTALAVIPVSAVDVELLRDSLPDLVQRLRHLVKGRVQQFDYTLLGSKFNIDDTLPQTSREVANMVSYSVRYAEFIGHDHIRFTFVERLWDYLNTQQNELTRRYNRDADIGGAPLIGVYNAAAKENERLDELKRRALDGIESPFMHW